MSEQPTATPNALDRARAFRAATNPEEHAEVTAARTAARKAREAARDAEMHLANVERLTTPALQATADSDSDAVGPGPRRAAAALLRHPAVNTPTRRRRAEAIAHTGMNLGLWARWSQAVDAAAADLARMIADGREGAEHHAEQTARRYREADTAQREANLRAVAAATLGR